MEYSRRGYWMIISSLVNSYGNTNIFSVLGFQVQSSSLPELEFSLVLHFWRRTGLVSMSLFAARIAMTLSDRPPNGMRRGGNDGLHQPCAVGSRETK